MIRRWQNKKWAAAVAECLCLFHPKDVWSSWSGELRHPRKRRRLHQSREQCLLMKRRRLHQKDMIIPHNNIGMWQQHFCAPILYSVSQLLLVQPGWRVFLFPFSQRLSFKIKFILFFFRCIDTVSYGHQTLSILCTFKKIKMLPLELRYVTYLPISWLKTTWTRISCDQSSPTSDLWPAVGHLQKSIFFTDHWKLIKIETACIVLPTCWKSFYPRSGP